MRSVEKLDRAQDGAFDYLLRQPRRTRRWPSWLIACIVALASLAWAIGALT